MVYTYAWYQWLMFFYIYCFFGWIFESTYVSLKSRRFVNRGFLRAPMLPLYGTGAVMMLWVSLPVQDNLAAVFFFGVIAATILEYVTGWAMERMFKVRYWDYSNQKFQLNGYICLSSSIAWGFLSIFLTEVIHSPIEYFVLHMNPVLELVLLPLITIVFASDTIATFKTAWDLGRMLEYMSKVKAELEEVQVQLSLLKAEATQRFSDAKEDTSQMVADFKAETTARITDMVEDQVLRAASLKAETAHLLADQAERITALTEKLQKLTETKHTLTKHLGFFKTGLLKGNPSASSRFSEALQELRETLKDYRQDSKHDSENNK